MKMTYNTHTTPILHAQSEGGYQPADQIVKDTFQDNFFVLDIEIKQSWGNFYSSLE